MGTKSLAMVVGSYDDAAAATEDYKALRSGQDAGGYEVIQSGVTYGAQPAFFGPRLDTTGVTGPLTVADDGVGTGSDGCEALPAVASTASRDIQSTPKARSSAVNALAAESS